MRVSDAQLERRRRRILEAAATCFGRHGIRGTTIKEICAEGNFSPGLVYHYFKAKEEIVAAVADRFSDHELASLAVATAAIQAKTEPHEVLAALLDYMRAEDGALAISLIAEASRDEALRQKLLQHEQRAGELIQEVIHLRLNGRSLEDRDEEDIVAAVLLLREGLRIMSGLRGEASAGSQALNVLLRAIGAERSSSTTKIFARAKGGDRTEGQD